MCVHIWESVRRDADVFYRRKTRRVGKLWGVRLFQ